MWPGQKRLARRLSPALGFAASVPANVREHQETLRRPCTPIACRPSQPERGETQRTGWDSSRGEEGVALSEPASQLASVAADQGSHVAPALEPGTERAKA